MANTAKFVNKYNGKIKEVKMGYSWTTFFFGFWPDLFRGNFKWAAITFFASLLLGLFTMGVGTLLYGIVFAAFRNRRLIEFYVNDGYELADGDLAQVEAYIGNKIGVKS